jgi:two-component system, NarL family, invasion response regulator UvrY
VQEDIDAMIRVFIADDHAGIREGIRRILDDVTDMCVVGEASDVQELLIRMTEQVCDVVLLDSTLPGQNGIDLLPCFKRTYPSLFVLVCSTYVGPHYVQEAFEAGATGYLTKDRLPEELVEAIRQVAQGQRYVSPTSATYLNDQDTLENGATV